MEHVTERLTIAVALLSAGGLLSILWQFRSLSGALRVRGLGRIFYLSSLAFFSWAGLVIAYFLLNTLVPNAFGVLDAGGREVVRLFFLVYLLALVGAANVAIYRWRREN